MTPTAKDLERARDLIHPEGFDIDEIAQALADERERTQQDEWAAWATWCDIQAERVMVDKAALQDSGDFDSPKYWAQEGLRRAYLHVASVLRNPAAIRAGVAS